MEGRHVPIKWAQRKAQVFVTLEIPNLVDNSWTILPTEEGHITFKATSKDTNTEVAVEMDLFEKIVPADCKWKVTGRNVQLSLAKQNTEAEYWPRLVKQAGKTAWIAIDWSKWVDEDEEGAQGKPDFDMDFNNMGGMGGMGGMGDYGEYDEGEDSDEEEEEEEEEEAPADLGDLEAPKEDIPTVAQEEQKA